MNEIQMSEHYVVLGSTLLLWASVLLYLLRLEGKVRKLERQCGKKDET